MDLKRFIREQSIKNNTKPPRVVFSRFINKGLFIALRLPFGHRCCSTIILNPETADTETAAHELAHYLNVTHFKDVSHSKRFLLIYYSLLRNEPYILKRDKVNRFLKNNLKVRHRFFKGSAQVRKRF